MHRIVRTLLFTCLGISIFTGALCCLAPIKYSPIGTLVKQNEREQILLSKNAKGYIDRHSVSKCLAKISNRSMSIHLYYVNQDESHCVYDCWMETGDDFEFGLYEINLILGEIKLWSILLNYF